MFILVKKHVKMKIQISGNKKQLNFVSDRKKPLMRIMLIASALIPMYIIYLTFADPPIWLGIFTSIYSFFMVVVWFLFYFDFFIKKPTFNGQNGKLSLNNE